MRWLTGVAGLASLALAGPMVDPPTRAGAWQQLGAAQTSRPGRQLHFFRTAQNPKALAVVVVSSSRRPITVLWASDCEIFDDDTGEEQNQATVTGVKRVVAYPPVLAGATRCYLWVNASMAGKGKLSAAEFAS